MLLIAGGYNNGYNNGYGGYNNQRGYAPRGGFRRNNNQNQSQA